MKKKQNKDAFLRMYQESHGFIAKSCEAANISRFTYYEWMKKDEDFKQLVEEIDQSFIDLAESRLREKVAAGEWTQVKYYLETHAKNRGYIGEQTNMNVGGALKLEITKNVIQGGAKE